MHKLIIKSGAEKALKRLPHKVYLAAKKRMLHLRNEPRPPGVKKLRDNVTWRIRMGDYRIVYTIDDREKIVRIVTIAHRQSVYEDRRH